MRPTLVMALLAALGWGAHPAPVSMPPGWHLSGHDLVWSAPSRIPAGDAAVEFWAGDRLLGRPRSTPDGRTFRLTLGDSPGAPADPRVRAAGRRLDVTRPSRRRIPLPIHPVAPVNPVDPGRPGRYPTVTGEYSLRPVHLAKLPAPVEMRAVVVAPAAAPGPRPLVLFLHGRHDTCRRHGIETIGWPCPAGTTGIPSYRGYRYAQRLLASQGYVTVSIAANGVNGQDESLGDSGAAARSAVVRRHLGYWAGWAGSLRATAPAIVRAVPRADLSRVLLVGHSRGGEGVDQAATDSVSPPPGERPARWTVRGVVLIGPTAYNQNPAPDVPSVSILPGCDGDVADLSGQLYVDGTRGVSRGAALHSAVHVAGADHNFFSTEWTGDDFTAGDDPICSPGAPTRLSAAEQRRVGATYIAAGARLFVAGDDRVRPLLDGSGFRARSAGRAVVRTDALGGDRTPLLVPGPSMTARGARLCAEVSWNSSAACLDPADEAALSPHFVPFYPVIPEVGRSAVAVTWSAPGRPVTLHLAAPISVVGARSVTLRIIVPPNTTGTRLGVALSDRRGHHADLGDVRLDGLAATPNTAGYWGQEVRVPMAAAAHRLDRAHIVALRLTPRTGSGHAWLLDAWGWRPGTPAPRPVALPRVDLGAVAVPEGDNGRHAARMPVTVTGRGTGQVRLWVSDPSGGRMVPHLVTLHPGDRSVTVRVSWLADRRRGGDDVFQIMAKAVHGAVVGDSRGSLVIRDDDGPYRSQ